MTETFRDGHKEHIHKGPSVLGGAEGQKGAVTEEQMTYLESGSTSEP